MPLLTFARATCEAPWQGGRKIITLEPRLRTMADVLRVFGSENNRLRVSDRALDLFQSSDYRVNTDVREATLLFPTTTDLGFSDGARLEDILHASPRLDILPCIPEVGPQFRRQFVGDHPRGLTLTIAMNPIRDSASVPAIFLVTHDEDDNLWLRAVTADPKSVWHKSDRWVVMEARL